MLRCPPTEIRLTAAEIERTVKRIEKRAKSNKSPGFVPVTVPKQDSQEKSRSLRKSPGNEPSSIVSPLRSFSITSPGDGMSTSGSEEDKSSDTTTSEDMEEFQSDASGQEPQTRENGQENDNVAAMAVFTQDPATQRTIEQFQNSGDGMMDDTPPRETRLHRHLHGDGSGSNDNNRETQ